MRKFEVVSAFLNESIEIPKRATKTSAGYDLASAKDYRIQPGEIVLIQTGLKVDMPMNEALFIFPRSSLGIKKHLMMSNGVGVVDSDYYNNKDNEGHLMIPLYNFSNQVVEVLKGERVAQGVFMAYKKTDDEDENNIARLGGFGSTL